MTSSEKIIPAKPTLWKASKNEPSAREPSRFAAYGGALLELLDSFRRAATTEDRRRVEAEKAFAANLPSQSRLTSG